LARTVVAKLGGSVITDKSKPFTYRSDVASALVEEIASSDEKVVVVHGGGSYGHTVAKRFGISSTSPSPGPGVSETRNAMYDLNALLCKTMMEYKLSPYPFSPFDLLTKTSRNIAASWLRGLVNAGLTPVTFGDVTLTQSGFRIMSGDNIVFELAKMLKPDRCVFAVDVDGVYEWNTRVIIPELSPSKIRRMKVAPGYDATGGMKLKLDVAAKIAAMGSKACFVSGYRRNEFAKSLKGQDFYGTLVANP
jgi:isopentenyl phosphate kinase